MQHARETGKAQHRSRSRPQTRVPVCQRRWLALLQTDQSDNQLILCSHEGPVGENKPASNHLHQDRPVSRVHGGHLQYFFIHQDGGETIPKGHGAKHQDIKQVHLLFSGNLDEQRPVEVTLPSYVKAYKNSSAQCDSTFHPLVGGISTSSSLYNHRKEIASNFICEK